jgi:hypothetical protein
MDGKVMIDSNRRLPGMATRLWNKLPTRSGKSVTAMLAFTCASDKARIVIDGSLRAGNTVIPFSGPFARNLSRAAVVSFELPKGMTQERINFVMGALAGKRIEATQEILAKEGMEIEIMAKRPEAAPLGKAMSGKTIAAQQLERTKGWVRVGAKFGATIGAFGGIGAGLMAFGTAAAFMLVPALLTLAAGAVGGLAVMGVGAGLAAIIKAIAVSYIRLRMPVPAQAAQKTS